MATWQLINALGKPVDLTVPGTSFIGVVCPGARVNRDNLGVTVGTIQISQAHMDALNNSTVPAVIANLAMVSVMDVTNPNTAATLSEQCPNLPGSPRWIRPY